MWAEDDFLPPQPRLRSIDQPDDGKTYTMYHGTTREAAASILKSGFRPSKDGMLGRGVYLSRDLQKASRYPLDLPESQRVVIRVKVDVGKVIAINRQGHPKQTTWRQYGYDTAWCPPNCGMVKSGLEEDCVWDPKRITVMNLIYPKDLWAEDDFLPPGQPRLSSLEQPGDGKTYTMYHGTSREAAASIQKSGFTPSSDGMLGRGVYLSRDLQKASRYPLDLPESQRVVIRVKVDVGKVIAINCQGHPKQTTWRQYGYDTAWCPPNCGMVKSGLEEDCVWDPKRITVMNLIYPKDLVGMWAEDDFLPYCQPRLSSLEQPDDGKTYTMYHGTTREAAASILKSGFTPSSDGMLGRGVYLSRDLQKASRYPLDLPESQRVVIKVKVNVGKVIAINRQGHPKQTTWRQYGYDTAWCPPNCGMVKSGLEEDCVWDPKKITVMNLIYPKDLVGMWAEYDFLPPGQPHLSSLEQPGDGKTYTMYHGTSREAAASIIQRSKIRPSNDGMLGRGVYLSRDLQKASRYPLDLPESQRVVIRVKVNVGKVIAINSHNHPKRKSWRNSGYNTAWVTPNCGHEGVPSGLEEGCVWNPKMITVMNLIYPKDLVGMWAEDDFLQTGQSRLSSFDQPDDGKTYTMYHGTSREAAASIQKSGFTPSSDGMLGRGVYLSRDLQKASRYPLDLPESQRVVIRVKVNVGKVIAINRQGHPQQMTWHQSGYDTAWCPPNCGMVKSGLEEDCVWDPKKITVMNLIYPKDLVGMWAEDDFLPPGQPRLSSLEQPDDGKTYTMYHGTSREAAASIIQRSKIRPSKDGMLGIGVYLSRDLQKASRYPLDLPESQRVVIRVKVDMGNVIAINSHDHPKRKSWRHIGYNTAWVPWLEECCVYNPKKITVMNLIYPKGGQHAGASGFYR